MKTIKDIRDLSGLARVLAWLKTAARACPLDEVRQAFKSHFTRLVNLDKSPLDDLQKKLIKARKSAIQRAQKLYIARQTSTLGVGLTANQ